MDIRLKVNINEQGFTKHFTKLSIKNGLLLKLPLFLLAFFTNWKRNLGYKYTKFSVKKTIGVLFLQLRRVWRWEREKMVNFINDWISYMPSRILRDKLYGLSWSKFLINILFGWKAFGASSFYFIILLILKPSKLKPFWIYSVFSDCLKG